MKYWSQSQTWLVFGHNWKPWLCYKIQVEISSFARSCSLVKCVARIRVMHVGGWTLNVNVPTSFVRTSGTTSWHFSWWKVTVNADSTEVKFTWIADVAESAVCILWWWHVTVFMCMCWPVISRFTRDVFVYVFCCWYVSPVFLWRDPFSMVFLWSVWDGVWLTQVTYLYQLMCTLLLVSSSSCAMIKIDKINRTVAFRHLYMLQGEL